jgi:hypothetical protein
MAGKTYQGIDIYTYITIPKQMATVIQENRTPIIVIVVAAICIVCICCIMSSLASYFWVNSNRNRGTTPPPPTPTPPPPSPSPTPGPAPNGLFYLGPRTIPGNQGFTKSESSNVCQRFNARQAHLSDLQQAFSRGYDLCEFGWLSDQKYSMMSQQRDNPPNCRGPGITQNAVDDPSHKSGVYCVGPLRQDIQSFPRNTWTQL